MGTHPEFSPLVPRLDRDEYQIVWVRSWKPTIYLRAYLQREQFRDYEHAYVEYSFVDGTLSQLHRKEVSLTDWQYIDAAATSSDFWSDGSRCDEISYQNQELYFEAGGECTEIMMTDGAQLSIAGSKQRVAKGRLVACNGLGSCEPYDGIAVAILRAIGEEHRAQ